MVHAPHFFLVVNLRLRDSLANDYRLTYEPQKETERNVEGWNADNCANLYITSCFLLELTFLANCTFAVVVTVVPPAAFLSPGGRSQSISRAYESYFK